MSLRQFIVNSSLQILPPTRLYRFKARLLQWAGYDIHPTARCVSSLRIWGEMPLHIGEDTFIGHEVLITGAAAEIFIGDYVDIAPRVTLISGTHEIDMIGNHSAKSEGISKPIVIEDGAWIGAGCIIVGGVSIGRKSIIGAGSVVVKDIPALTVAVGNPCRPIKRWDPERQIWQPLQEGK